MKYCLPKTVTLRRKNKVIRIPVSSLATRDLKTLKDIFKFFIDDEMLNILIENTNTYIQSISPNFERERDA